MQIGYFDIYKLYIQLFINVMSCLFRMLWCGHVTSNKHEQSLLRKFADRVFGWKTRVSHNKNDGLECDSQ